MPTGLALLSQTPLGYPLCSVKNAFFIIIYFYYVFLFLLLFIVFIIIHYIAACVPTIKTFLKSIIYIFLAFYIAL